MAAEGGFAARVSAATASATDEFATYTPPPPAAPAATDVAATMAAIRAAKESGADTAAVTKAALLELAHQKAAEAKEAAKRRS